MFHHGTAEVHIADTPQILLNRLGILGDFRCHALKREFNLVALGGRQDAKRPKRAKVKHHGVGQRVCKIHNVFTKGGRRVAVTGQSLHARFKSQSFQPNKRFHDFFQLIRRVQSELFNNGKGFLRPFSRTCNGFERTGQTFKLVVDIKDVFESACQTTQSGVSPDQSRGLFQHAVESFGGVAQGLEIVVGRRDDLRYLTESPLTVRSERLKFLTNFVAADSLQPYA